MPAPQRFAEKIRAERGYSRYLLKGLDYTGRNAWYSLEISPTKEQAFLKAWQGLLAVDLTEWGTLLASGYGEPPEANLTPTMDFITLGYWSKK